MHLLRWAALIVALCPLSCFATLGPFQPALFNDRRQNASIGDPKIFYYFSECSNGGLTSYSDSFSDDELGGFAKNVETCPVEMTGTGTFANSMNGVRFDAVRSGTTDTKGLESTGTYATTATAWTAEFWLKLESPALSNRELQLLLIGEIPSPTPTPTSFPYSCLGGEEIALLIGYQPTAQELLLEVNTDGTSNCLRDEVALSLDEDTLTHVAVSFEDTAVDTYIVRVYKNGQFVGSANGFDVGTSFQLSTSTANKWYLGSSPKAVTSDSGAATPWGGTVAMFAFYEKTLTQGEISYLYNAWLPNNPPVRATTNRNRTALEDQTLDITLTLGVDYWDEDEANGFGASIVTNIVTVPGGTLNDDVGTISGAQAVTGQLQYNQENPNEFDLASPDTFTFTVSDTIATSAASTMEISIDATNDKPLATSETIQIPAFQTRTITIEGTDVVDCPSLPCTPANFQPTTFTIEGISNDFGQFREQHMGGCPSSGTMGDNITLPYAGPTTLTDGTFSICYTAFGDVSASASANGIVGIDHFNFTVSDVSETSDEASIKIEVTSVLSIVDPIRVDIFEEEATEIAGNASDFDSYVNVSYLLEFIGVDNKCEDIIEENGLVVGVTPKVGISGCDSRDKEYVVIGPLPTDGILLYQEGGILKELTEDDLEPITGLTVDGFVLPEERSQIIFKPAEDYMNAVKSPLCANSIGLDDEQSRCAAIGETEPYDPSGADCVGILCPDFTTDSFNGTFGDCGAAECPVEVFYKLKVGDAYSPDITEPGVRILVKNEFDLARLVFDPVTTRGAAGVGYVKNIDTLIRTDSGDPVVINAVDGDSRILQLSFQSGGQVEGGSIRFDPDFSGTQVAIDSNIYDFDSCLFLGCTVNDPFTMQGSASQLNLVLENLIFSHTDSDENQEETLSITLSDPYPNGNAGSITVNMVINFKGEDPDGGLFSDIQFIAIVAAAGSLCLMAIISWVACFTKRCNQYCQAGLKVRDVILRKNTDLNKRAHQRRSWDARNVDILKRAIKEEHKEEGRMLGCFKCLACICPCMGGIDTKNVRPKSVREMEIDTYRELERDLARGAVPKHGDNSFVIEKPEHYGEWRLEHDDDGHAFWWNPTTDQSQWHSPYPEGHPVLEAAKREKAKRAVPKPPSAKKKKNQPPPTPETRPKRRFTPKPPPKPSI